MERDLRRALLDPDSSGRLLVDLHVRQAETNRPIEGAILYLKNERVASRSDLKGKVYFRGRTMDELLADTLVVTAKNHTTQRFSMRDVLGKSETDTFADTALFLPYNADLVNPVEAAMQFTKADTLRGSYGALRINTDIKHYDLRIRLDVEKKYLSGNNVITFLMLRPATRIQIDLFDNMAVDSILFNGEKLSYKRKFNAVFVDFPQQLQIGMTYSIDFHYSGHPLETGRFGGIAYKADSLGNPWIYTACQGTGASLWWPNKDQAPDEPDSMRMRVIVPSDLVDASNGRLQKVTDLGDGTSEYDWKIHYPINNYCVSLNIGKYTHYEESLGDVSIDYYVQPYHLEQAKRQFAQVKPMLKCFEEKFGPYPFPKDGFKLIEVPYSGMEHQSAVTYGNLFKNGYLGRDWTGVGVSMKFDFIIIHESGHEWFGNSITANDVSDAWIQEGWTTYSEAVYVECLFGYNDAMDYVNGYKSKVQNKQPIIGFPGVNKWPTSDQYFKGALILNTFRSVFDNDKLWWKIIREYNDEFRYQNIYTTDIINFMHRYTEMDLMPLFQQYLYHAALPKLQFHRDGENVSYRWDSDVVDFAMPIDIIVSNRKKRIYPTTKWQTDKDAAEWVVDTERFYVDVEDKR
ncbi:MAG: M1 family metallopeptidase [Calditrichia bacterium]